MDRGPCDRKGMRHASFAESYFGLGEHLQMLIDKARTDENMALV